jgi:hypothetical protein
MSSGELIEARIAQVERLVQEDHCSTFTTPNVLMGWFSRADGLARLSDYDSLVTDRVPRMKPFRVNSL